MKAIWEPVNYTEDVNLTDVHFSTPETGWVTGNAGTILYTGDGGKSWKAQLGGDPKAADRPIVQLRFVDAMDGFAAQSTSGGDHKLLATTNGQDWEQPGTVAQHRTDYEFVSPTDGFQASGARILHTTDAGRSWQTAYTCAVKTEIQGLTRDVTCEFEKLAFPSASVGYAVSRRIGNEAGSVLAKTEDGGATWKAWVIVPGEDAKEAGLAFTDANTGVLRMLDGKIYRTADGGKTWTGAIGQADGRFAAQFADAEVGWIIGYRTMTYTTNGGRKWTSRSIAFPAAVNAFCIVGRDHGYVVGDHGMVYRYRVVPVTYSSKGMLDAPMMPGK
ncbi:MAG: WD40/YVTN/BNR-like repeat-containing protein [Candidatus Sulfotelmatobacter sp.]